jgi:hypothetical protein
MDEVLLRKIKVGEGDKAHTFDVQQLISTLKFFSKLDEEEKIDVANLGVQKDNWVTSLWRTFLQRTESKEKSLVFIQKIYEESIQCAEFLIRGNEPFHKDVGNLLIKSLEEAQKGVETRKELYKDNKKFVSDIETFVTVVSSKIKHLKEIKRQVDAGVVVATVEKSEEDPDVM